MMGGEELAEKVGVRKLRRAEREALLARGLKVCSGKPGCGRELPVEAFSSDCTMWDGLSPYCKECRAKRSLCYRSYILGKKDSIDAHRKSQEEKAELASRGLKRCINTGCGQILPIEEFHKNSQTGDGLSARCKSCNIAHVRKWYDDNPDRVREWREANREWGLLHVGAYRARQAGNEADSFGWLELLEHWASAGVRFDQCHLCGEIGEYGGHNGLHIDHIVPISRGGAHSMDNLRPACASCNRMKNCSTLDEYRDKVVRTASFLLSDN